MAAKLAALITPSHHKPTMLTLTTGLPSFSWAIGTDSLATQYGNLARIASSAYSIEPRLGQPGRWHAHCFRQGYLDGWQIRQKIILMLFGPSREVFGKWGGRAKDDG